MTMNSTADIPCYSLVVLETVIAVTAVIAAGCCLSDSAAEELIVGDAWCIESKVEKLSQVSWGIPDKPVRKGSTSALFRWELAG